MCFGRLRAKAEILCTRCGHRMVVKGDEFGNMFPTPLPLEWARFRLRCTRCGQRAAEITPVYKPERG